ncbi:MAG: hypothetical protein Fur0021_19680 [Candidatus Promineifilaceae bacterium]
MAFPKYCPDRTNKRIGTDEHLMSSSLQAEIPALSWPLREKEIPPTLAILDLIQFCYRNVAKPLKKEEHRYGDSPHWLDHSHLEFDRQEGRTEFRQKINLIFARNGLAFELEDRGPIVRLAPSVLREALQAVIFRTGDATLDSMLETARINIYRQTRQCVERLLKSFGMRGNV